MLRQKAMLRVKVFVNICILPCFLDPENAILPSVTTESILNVIDFFSHTFAKLSSFR